MGGIFTTELYAEHKTFGYHQTVCGARNPAYCKCAVSGWANDQAKMCHCMFFCHEKNGFTFLTNAKKKLFMPWSKSATLSCIAETVINSSVVQKGFAALNLSETKS